MDSNQNYISQFHIPPIVGEYGYYYSKSTWYRWLVITEDGKEVTCHYSTKAKSSYKPFVTCHGIIKRITKELKKYN